MTPDVMHAAVLVSVAVIVGVPTAAVAGWVVERALRWQDAASHRDELDRMRAQRDKARAEAEYWRRVADHPVHRAWQRRCRVGERA